MSVLFIILVCINMVFIFLIWKIFTSNIRPNHSITGLISVCLRLFLNNVCKSIVLPWFFFSIDINHTFFPAALRLFIPDLNCLRRITRFILWCVGLVNESNPIMWMILTSHNSFSKSPCFHSLLCSYIGVNFLLFIIFWHEIFLLFFNIWIILLLIEIGQWLRFHLIFLLLYFITLFRIILRFNLLFIIIFSLWWFLK